MIRNFDVTPVVGDSHPIGKTAIPVPVQESAKRAKRKTSERVKPKTLGGKNK